MEPHFPDDADGNALRRLVEDGSDLTQPMLLNFQVAVPDETAAKELAEVASKLGYGVIVYPSPECSLPWTCECSTRMLANYEAIPAIQRELSELTRPFAGSPDGWGSFGNKPVTG